MDGQEGGDEVQVATVPAVLTGSPKNKTRTRQRKRHAGHVHWDEQAIEEHNKERGTRQKIDEPDTPYVRSPQTASDSEGASADERDPHHHKRSCGPGQSSSSQSGP